MRSIAIVMGMATVVGCSQGTATDTQVTSTPLAVGDDINCDPASPPQCSSLAEAQFLISSPNFTPWFMEDICPIGLDIGGEWVQLVPWFCDSTAWFPEACMRALGPQPAGSIQVACCNPSGVAIMNECSGEDSCPHPHSGCYERVCTQIGVCAIGAKTDGTVCPGAGGVCTAGKGEGCPYSGPPPVCGGL